MAENKEYLDLTTSWMDIKVPKDDEEPTEELVIFKSDEKQLANIRGFWWVEVTCIPHYENYEYDDDDYPQSHSGLRVYVHLELNDDSKFNRGVQANVKFAFDEKKVHVDALNFTRVTMPVQLECSKSIFTAQDSSPFTSRIHIKLELKLKRPPRRESTSQAAMKSNMTLKTFFVGMQDQDDFKDFTFVVDNQQIKVHKNVFAATSEVFRTMFTSEFQESKNNSTIVTDIDPEVFQVLVDFMYGNKSGFNSKFKNFVHAIFRAAHKYEIQVLQDFCVDYIFEHCTGPDRALETFAFASFYDLKDLKDCAWDTIRYDILDNEYLKPPPAEKVKEFCDEMQHYREGLEKVKMKLVDVIYDHYL